MLHGHGDDAYRYKNKVVADFSTNVWSGSEPEGLKEHLFSRWELIRQYPEVLGESLGRMVAAHHGIKEEQVLISNGTTESIYLLAQAFAGGRTSVAVPAFSEYEDACRMHHHQLDYPEFSSLDSLQGLKSSLLFLCNPNNPTGSVYSQTEDLLKKNPETLLVLDEAFIDFTRAIPSAVPLLSRYPNLLILRSMTKTYAIPGLRLGYMLGAPGMIKRLQELKSPWSVNTLALEAGKYIFDHYQKLRLPLENQLQEKDLLVRELQKNPSIKVHTSHTHFFLAETGKGTAAGLKHFLLEGYGILIRDASNFRGLGEKHFRLATLSHEKNQLLIHALQEWNHHCS